MPWLLSSLQLSSRKRGQRGFKCQPQTLQLLQPEAAGAEPLAETPPSPRPLEPEASKNDCEASSRPRFRAEIFQQGAAHPCSVSAALAKLAASGSRAESHTRGTEPRTRLNPTPGATLGGYSMARRLITNSCPGHRAVRRRQRSPSRHCFRD